MRCSGSWAALSGSRTPVTPRSRRVANDAELTGAVDAWCREQSVDEVESRLSKAGIPVAKVRSPAQAVADPLLNERREITGVTHPDRLETGRRVLRDCSFPVSVT